jgi:hypothetical protein
MMTKAARILQRLGIHFQLREYEVDGLPREPAWAAASRSLPTRPVHHSWALAWAAG